MISIALSALNFLCAKEWLVGDTYCRSCVGRVIAGMNGVLLLYMLARCYIADVRDYNILRSTQIRPRYTICITVLGRKIKYYAVSEFKERLCDFRCTSLTRTNMWTLEAVMVDVLVFGEIPWYMVCS